MDFVCLESTMKDFGTKEMKCQISKMISTYLKNKSSRIEFFDTTSFSEKELEFYKAFNCLHLVENMAKNAVAFDDKMLCKAAVMDALGELEKLLKKENEIRSYEES